jgi:antitoxin Phd
MEWQLQKAKNKLSQLVREAQRSGPQVITVRGQAAVVVLSAEEYRKLTRSGGSLIEFLQESPWAEVELGLRRNQDNGRDVEL